MAYRLVNRLSVLFLFICYCDIVNSQRPVDYVDPYIGTGLHGHVFLGANVPFGGVQLGPVNLSVGWDWCSGYNYSDSTIIGFSHLHLSGTGIGDLGDILMMPATGDILLTAGKLEDPSNGYYSKFSHQDEIAKAGYYSVNLPRYQIKAELTASARIGFHQYTFPASSSSHIILDLVEGIGWDRPRDTYVRQLNDSTLIGYRFSSGWASDQRVYFAAVFSRPFEKLNLYRSKSPEMGNVLMGDSVKAVVSFTTKKDEIIKVKVGISPVSTTNALMNIDSEIPGWDFAKTRQQAEDLWNKELRKVVIKSDSKAVLRNFYTALYHTQFSPFIYNDANGDYYGTDKQVHLHAPFTNFSFFSLWDTYRAANPLYTILQPSRVSDMVNSMLAIYQQQGRLPVWHLMSNETNTMPGNSGIHVVAEAIEKGITGFDTALAYEAMKATNLLDMRGLKFLKHDGYIPGDSMVESVSLGMEYAIADGHIAQVAKRMGKKEDYDLFSRRASFYKKYYDPSTGFVRGRLSETEWRTPFSPFTNRHMKDDFSEGNAWQYTWLAPHDVNGLIELLGGDKKFNKKLDSLFILNNAMGEEASDDISGLIGQYAHGNEPGHHITYLYAYSGEPWKTAIKVRYIMDSLYSDKPAGLSGNEDAGQMSAWYIFSALGFYPVDPASGIYVFGTPSVNAATINLENGKTFSIKVNNLSPENRFIQYVVLNGVKSYHSYLLHSDIMKGGELVIEMGRRPSKVWGITKQERPLSGR